MTPRVATEELIDAHAVAEILGLAQRNTVSIYQRRYPDMPRPVIDLGAGRPKLWLRPAIEAWAVKRLSGKRRRTRRPGPGARSRAELESRA